MIAEVTSSDLPDLLPLLRDYCTFYEATPEDRQLLAMSEALLAVPGEGVQLLARDRTAAAVGFVTMLWSWDLTVAGRTAVLHDLFVVPSARGSGIASSLIEHCARMASDRGCRYVKWQTAPDNAPAQQVYDRTGARATPWVEYMLPL